MDLSRRRLLLGALAAPAVIAAARLMRVKSWSPVADSIERRWNAGMVIDGEVLAIERSVVLPGDTGAVISNCVIRADGLLDRDFAIFATKRNGHGAAGRLIDSWVENPRGGGIAFMEPEQWVRPASWGMPEPGFDNPFPTYTMLAPA